jgi:hypothetical protein
MPNNTKRECIAWLLVVKDAANFSNPAMYGYKNSSNSKEKQHTYPKENEL